jgi:hypothetical protein
LFLLCITIVAVAAIKPIKNLQVSFRGQSYTIHDGCSTIQELTNRFEEISGNHGIKQPQFLCNGIVLKPDEPLAKAGVKPGDKILIVPHQSDAKTQDVLAMYLFLLSHGSESFEKAMSSLTEEQKEGLEQFKELVRGIHDNVNTLTRKDVADGLRHGFDVAYHHLRSLWEHPQLRQGLHDPERIEAYRKVVSTNMSPGLMKKSPQLQKAVKSKDAWRKEFVKMASNIIRLGDVILDGMLDVLLDILKGQGSSWKYAADMDRSGTLGRLDDTSSSSFKDPRTDDPALANELLFELSESEED